MSAHRFLLSATVSALALTAATGVQAQGIYAGLGFELASGTLSDGGITFDTDNTAVSLILGYRHDLANDFYLAGEFEAGQGQKYDYGSGPDYGSLDLVMRARALGGYSFGNVGLFGALGYASARGDFLGASDTTTIDGLTFGLGADIRASDRLTLRIEAISDRLSGDVVGGNYDWDNTGIRAAALFTF